MARFFPGTGALRSFESAARLLNFSHAASELGLTPAAVSHRVKEIEDQLGVTLFIRTSRSMELTSAGKMLQEAAGEALEALGRGIDRVQRSSKTSQLRVIASASLAAKWLVPRIGNFVQLRPDIDLRLDIVSHLRGFVDGDADIAIRWGGPLSAGFRSDRLFENAVSPVCSPALLEADPVLREPRDLLRHRLIHVSWSGQDAQRPNWRKWLRAAGVNDFEDGPSLRFDDTGPALQAAIDGQGVALGDSSLVLDDLASGRLVQPFALSIVGLRKFAYYVVSPVAVADAPSVHTFREWVLAEAGKSARVYAQYIHRE